MADKIKIALAVALVIAGLFGYYHWDQSALIARVGCVLGGAVAAVVVFWTSAVGKEFFFVCPRIGRRSQARGLADAQRNDPNDCGRFWLCSDHGDFPLADRCVAVVGGALTDGAGRFMSKKWYVVHAYSGFEKTVQRTLTERIARAGMQEQFGRVLVPVEEVVEMRSGQKNISERKFFPGYVLVEMDMTDESWHLVKSTPKVTGFIGGTSTRPTPISEKEVQNILHQIQEGVEKPRPKVLFENGEMVRVKEGPFTDFNGTVEDVNYDKNKIRVAVTIFGCSTPVELDFGQVEKA